MKNLRDYINTRVIRRLRDEVRNQVVIKIQIRERASSQIWNQLNIKDVSNKVNSRIGDQLTVLLWDLTKGQVKDKLWNQIRGQIRKHVSSQIWNQLNQISNRVKNDTEL